MHVCVCVCVEERHLGFECYHARTLHVEDLAEAVEPLHVVHVVGLKVH